MCNRICKLILELKVKVSVNSCVSLNLFTLHFDLLCVIKLICWLDTFATEFFNKVIDQMHLLTFFCPCVVFLFIDCVNLLKKFLLELFLLLGIKFLLLNFLFYLFSQLFLAQTDFFLCEFFSVHFKLPSEQFPRLLYAYSLSINQQVDVLILQVNMLHLILIELFITQGETLVQFFNLLPLVSQVIYEPINNIFGLVILLAQVLNLSTLKCTHLLIL